jgi:hypothetical protein
MSISRLITFNLNQCRGTAIYFVCGESFGICANFMYPALSSNTSDCGMISFGEGVAYMKDLECVIQSGLNLCSKKSNVISFRISLIRSRYLIDRNRSMHSDSIVDEEI